MNVLVTGGTGTVGTYVVRQLVTQGFPVTVLVRPGSQSVPPPAGAIPITGNLDDPGSLANAMKGIERVFLLTPIHPLEAEMGINAIRAAQSAGVQRLVYMSGYQIEEGSHIPHFQSKIAIERQLTGAGIPYVVIRPNNFFQNDVQFKRDILANGVYPMPIGKMGLNRVDARDIADAIVNALTQGGHEGRRYALVGSKTLTGAAVAETYARHLRKPIVYAGDDLEAWEVQALKEMPPWLVHNVKIMYDYYQKHGFAASPQELAEQSEILGHPPRHFDAYVHELTAEWIGAQEEQSQSAEVGTTAG